MRKYNIDASDNESENSSLEIKEQESRIREDSHFASTYSLRPNEQYEVNHYSYETDRYGRIKRCEGTLRLEDGKRNTNHQVKAGGEYRLETDEGGHLIGRRFGGSEKVDNIVPMDGHVNRVEYKELEDDCAQELEKGYRVDVKVRCKYEEDSARPSAFIVKYKVTDQDGFTRSEARIISNRSVRGENDE